MYKIGLVGVGRWGEKIAKTICEFPEEARLVAICQRTPKEISWIPKYCKIYDNVSDMLRKTTLTHIITAIDPDGHYDVVEKATKYNIPIWLEKPMALSYVEAEHIFSLDGSIFVDYIHLYSECFEYLLKETKNKIINNSIIQTILYSEPYHTFPMLYNFASHDLSMLLEIFDNIQISNVFMSIENKMKHYNIEMTTDVGCKIITKIGNDERSGRLRKLNINIDDDNKYLYDGMIQTVFKNNKIVFVAKELPLKHAIRLFLSGKRVDKDKTLKITKLLDEIKEKSNDL
jgi:predicted dehydrogenase